ncbi:T9SS type A sorting domain-containing protein [candidate division KSB1 bacterium]|nr:T9SS type A sorting domain-containing protein [candidate division KSB1 bacterium]
MRLIRTTLDGFIMGSPIDFPDSSGMAYKILPCGPGRYVLSGITASIAAPFQCRLSMIDENLEPMEEESFEGMYFSAGACIRQASPLQVAVAGVIDPLEAAVMLVNTDCFVSAAKHKELPLSMDISVYPNPFNAMTTIRYSVDPPGFSSLKVYNTLGKEVTTLFDGPALAGTHLVTWDAANFASGVYFVRMRQGIQNNTQKVVLMK